MLNSIITLSTGMIMQYQHHVSINILSYQFFTRQRPIGSVVLSKVADDEANDVVIGMFQSLSDSVQSKQVAIALFQTRNNID